MNTAHVQQNSHVPLSSFDVQNLYLSVGFFVEILICHVLCFQALLPPPNLRAAGKVWCQDLKGYKGGRYILFFSSAERTPRKIKVTGF